MCDTDGFSYITSEFVIPAKDKDFIQLYGINFNKFVSIINTVCSWYGGKRSYFHDTLSYDEMENLQEKYDDIRMYVDYVSNYQPPIGDMTRLVNYGMVMRDGSPMIVLLDSGLNEIIWNTHYNKSRR